MQWSTPRFPAWRSAQSETPRVCAAGMSSCATQENAGSSQFRAILVSGQNAERAPSDCLFACLQFEDTTTGVREGIGCDASCDNHFGCCHPSQMGNTRHCCDFVLDTNGMLLEAAAIVVAFPLNNFGGGLPTLS
jgi:hypothetical protein